MRPSTLLLCEKIILLWKNTEKWTLSLFLEDLCHQTLPRARMFEFDQKHFALFGMHCLFRLFLHSVVWFWIDVVGEAHPVYVWRNLTHLLKKNIQNSTHVCPWTCELLFLYVYLFFLFGPEANFNGSLLVWFCQFALKEDYWVLNLTIFWKF